MLIAVCDDLTAHREKLKAITQDYFDSRNIPLTLAEYACGRDLLNSEEKFDIVFLDIELGDLNGIDVAVQLKTKLPACAIIAVTSYTDYLDAAMDVQVIRFIHKPIDPVRVVSALNKAVAEMNENIITLCAKDNRIIRVHCRDIIYAEANLKKVVLHTVQETYTIKESLKKLKTFLSSAAFAVPHNSFIVNMNYISDFSRERITLRAPQGEIVIQVANRQQPAFKRRFLEFIREGD